MSEHAWFQENLAGYSAGGLTAAERERFELHAAGCEECAATMAEWHGLDQALEGLFAEVRPEAGWENRLIQTLRSAPPRRRPRWPAVGIFAASAAAVVLLGLVGATVHGFVVKGNLPFPGMWEASAKASNALKQTGPIDHSRSMGMGTGSMTVDVDGDGSLSDATKKNTEQLPGQSHHGPNFFPPSLGLIVKDKTESTIENRLEGLKNLEVASESKIAAMQDENRKLRMDGVSFERKLRAADESSLTLVEELRDLNRRIRGERDQAEWGFETGRKLTLGNKTFRDSKEASPSLVPSAKSPEYFKPTLAKLRPGTNLPIAGGKKEGKAKAKGDDGDKKQVAAGQIATNAGVGKVDPARFPALRKIIRTGDIEFEIESFDTAVAGVTRLVTAIKGGFVATINSEKLANGKVKGSVVVRMPPESLDKFLLDLRRDLAKTGDLKSQRIGSQDITKQYTDIESRLKAARTIEERLLNIIKTGKGEIKDLIAAEHELGIWRTKIEEMEGEIRYYNNQVALSTLTITLYEKEIRAASALVVTEHIKMRIEVEDVDKAHRSAVAAVAKAKGRVIKSDVKQHAAGQLEAILHFEVAPEPPDRLLELRKSLQGLGNVTQHEAQRLQQAEGGIAKSADIKARQNDVQFEVVLYNLADIQPRETHNLTIATLDVPAGYRKLQEAVKGKGQVRDGKLNEQDKLHISAQFDFDILSVHKEAIDKVLAEVGDVFSRKVDQAPIKENATERKVGYRLVLKNVASLQPREQVILSIDVSDVEKTAAAFVAVVRAAKGEVAANKLSIDKTGRVGLLLFDVPLSAKDELVREFTAAGTVRKRQTAPNPRVPDSPLATAHIDVTLTSAGPIVAGEDALWPQIRTSLFYSFKLLSWSIMFIILGLSVILPWALVVWGTYKLVRKLRTKVTSTTG